MSPGVYWLRSSVGSDLLSLTANRSRSVLAVKGPLRRFAPWTAPGRSGETRCSRGERGGSGRVDGPKGNLNFDTDDDGDVDSDDDYWNSGAGWDPIGEEDAPFTADFNGNRRTVSNLFIDRDTEDEVGLFGAVDRSRIRGVILAGVDVTGRDAVGSLLGDGVYGSVVDNHATGQVSGQDEVGGLVGRTWGTVWYSSAAINVSGNDAVGGLVGHQILNDTVASYSTGNVSGSGSRLTDSDSGFIICDLVGALSLTGPVETTTSTGGGVGGLVGSSCGYIQVSYATGAVTGTAAVGGLVGSGHSVKVQSSYWDLETSGVRVGVGEDDSNDNGVIDGTAPRTGMSYCCRRSSANKLRASRSPSGAMRPLPSRKFMRLRRNAEYSTPFAFRPTRAWNWR